MACNYTKVKRAGYNAIRAASQGASISLWCGSGRYVAEFECATRAAQVLGDRHLTDLGDGIDEIIPELSIPFEEMATALPKLAERYSVALVDLVTASQRSYFVLIAKIPQTVKTVEPEDDFFGV